MMLMASVCGCDNHILEDMPHSEFKQKNQLQADFDQPVFDDFLDAFEDFIMKAQEINSQKDPEELQEMANLFMLCKEQPDEYLAILETNINTIYTDKEMEIMKNKFSDMEKASKKLATHPTFKTLSENDKQEFNNILSMRMLRLKPNINILDLNSPIKTRSESNNCADICKDEYYLDLLQIAAGVLCAGGAAALTACFSLGTLSIPALIAAISSVGGASILIDRATASYYNCLKAC